MMHPHLVCLVIALLSVAGLEIFLFLFFLDPNIFWIVNTLLLVFLAIVGLFSPCKCCTSSTIAKEWYCLNSVSLDIFSSQQPQEKFLRRQESLVAETCSVPPHLQLPPVAADDHHLGNGFQHEQPPADGHILGNGPPSLPPHPTVAINMEQPPPTQGVGLLPSYEEVLEDNDGLPNYLQALSGHAEANHI